MRPLVLVVKLWAQRYGINDAKNMTLSSYSLALMVINFLQCKLPWQYIYALFELLCVKSILLWVK